MVSHFINDLIKTSLLSNSPFPQLAHLDLNSRPQMFSVSCFAEDAVEGSSSKYGFEVVRVFLETAIVQVCFSAAKNNAAVIIIS